MATVSEWIALLQSGKYQGVGGASKSLGKTASSSGWSDKERAKAKTALDTYFGGDAKEATAVEAEPAPVKIIHAKTSEGKAVPVNKTLAAPKAKRGSSGTMLEQQAANAGANMVPGIKALTDADMVARLDAFSSDHNLHQTLAVLNMAISPVGAGGKSLADMYPAIMDKVRELAHKVLDRQLSVGSTSIPAASSAEASTASVVEAAEVEIDEDAVPAVPATAFRRQPKEEVVDAEDAAGDLLFR